MKRLKLLRLGSYTGHGIRVTQAQPFVDLDDELARVLLGTGYFAEEPGPAPAEPATATAGPITTEHVITRRGGRRK